MGTAIDIAILILLVAAVVISIFTLTRFTAIRREINESRMETSKSVGDSISNIGSIISTNQKNAAESQEKRIDDLSEEVRRLSRDNNRQLEKMQDIVDEKLQKTLEERISKSFTQVNESLSRVTEGLGQMQSLASGVGDLKKVLSNVKTRGILGEVQLAAILDEILAPEQYEANAHPRPDSPLVVEFAVKLPGSGNGTVLLPIDSKFPADAYEKLLTAYEEADQDTIASCQKDLVNQIKKEAKDIHDKYIIPPYTTNFGILFLPFEGLYAEVIRLGLVEILQRDYKVNIAGPTTMAAMLNSLQMGFRTLAIQQRSSEVWELLGAVKTEFERFEKELDRARKGIEQADNSINTLLGTRTRMMKSKLKKVEELPEERAGELLDFDLYDEDSGEGGL